MKNSIPKKQSSIERNLVLLNFMGQFYPVGFTGVMSLVFWGVNNLLGVVCFFSDTAYYLFRFISLAKSRFNFHSLHNLFDSQVKGEYLFRGLGQDNGGGDLIQTNNAIASTLQKQSLQPEESQLLLRKIVDQIDVAIIAWDKNNLI